MALIAMVQLAPQSSLAAEQKDALLGASNYRWYRYIPRWQTIQPYIPSALFTAYSASKPGTTVENPTQNVGYHMFAPALVTATQHHMRSQQNPDARASGLWYFAPGAAALAASAALGKNDPSSSWQHTVGSALYEMGLHQLSMGVSTALYEMVVDYLSILRVNDAVNAIRSLASKEDNLSEEDKKNLKYYISQLLHYRQYDKQLVEGLKVALGEIEEKSVLETALVALILTEQSLLLDNRMSESKKGALTRSVAANLKRIAPRK